MILALLLKWKTNAQDKARFNTLMSAHGAALMRVPMGYVSRQADRQDLEQEIALAIWEAMPRWRKDASARTYAFRIAHNKCIDALRRKRPHVDLAQEPERPSETSSPEAQSSARQTLRATLEHLRALPLAQRQVLMLSLEDMTHQEIADTLGIKSNHVGVLLHRARTAIKPHKETP
jgi:RNA polymerase sigma-70 factor (ECF subfamily)